jgi:hypothetical protein
MNVWLHAVEIANTRVTRGLVTYTTMQRSVPVAFPERN